MRVVRTVSGLDDAGVGGCVFVPTMGALHAGHGALIRQAVRIAAEQGRARPGGAGVWVSIFVNPTQFDRAEDLARYPRTEEADLALCAACGADGVFVPGVEEVYPPGLACDVVVPGVGDGPGLEDRCRPGHFAGVCAVVGRLFDVVRPGVAVFGEKDWQQLAVVRAMVERDGAARGWGVRVVAGETVREADGLAMSSRNVRLGAEARARAAGISRALRAAQGCGVAAEAEGAMRRVLGDAGIEVEYAVVRDARTLGEVRSGEAGRALIAGFVGGVRLIDNAAWGWG
jgi:pantoate--beta-alanine ligase